ncbi:MAG: hypothetical protein ACI4TJ_08705 [Candidatus Cryptobacteroides sp.]
MKDIIITSRKLRRELWFLLGSFVVACGMNIYAIVRYTRPATELFSMIGYVIVTAIVIYLLLLPVRWIVCLVRTILTRH